MIDELFRAIDGKDAVKFASFLSPGCRFKFGNYPDVTGADNIREFVGGFFESIDSLAHVIKQSWDVPGGLICHGQVTYTRKDGSTMTVPFANILNLDATGIFDYMIFIDASELYR
ncbi:MAG: nuclear transport factor 2 family protein [Gammaproteobacteria bacterium]|nr:nuclear transport factor 2 family protein [Gammaproteobacteria bacterium]